jgi:hypothetical protein
MNAKSNCYIPMVMEDMNLQDARNQKREATRRNFLRFGAVIGACVLFAACAPSLPRTPGAPTGTAIPATDTPVTPSETPTKAPPTQTPTETQTSTPEPTPTPESYENISVLSVPMESVGCIDERLCFNLEPQDGHELWRQMITAWADSPEEQDYWKNFGLIDAGGDDLLKFVENNVGGPENAPYWLPFVAKDGTEFRILQGRYGGSGIFEVNTHLKNQLKEARNANDKEAIQNVGVYLDRIPFAAFSLDEWQNNPVKHDFFKQILNDNLRAGGATLQESGAGNIWTPFSLFGLVYYQGRFMFLIGNEKAIPPEVDLPWTEDIKNYYYMGGPEGIFRPDVDPIIATADWLTYTRLTSIWDEKPHPVEPNGPIARFGDQARYICTVWNIACDPLVPVKDVRPEDALFQPIR